VKLDHQAAHTPTHYTSIPSFPEKLRIGPAASSCQQWCALKIIGKEFQKNCYKTIFGKINTEEIFFQLTFITNKDYFSRKKSSFAIIYCRGICDLYLWS